MRSSDPEDELSLTAIYRGQTPPETGRDAQAPERAQQRAQEGPRPLLAEVWLALGFVVMGCSGVGIILSLVLVFRQREVAKYTALGALGGALAGLAFITVGTLLAHLAEIRRRLASED